MDYHGECAKNIFKHIRPQLPEECRSGRFLFINVWRNISDTPVGNDNMAMCDETSLAYPDDVIAADYFDKLFPVQHYRLIDYNRSKHRWVNVELNLLTSIRIYTSVILQNFSPV